MFSVGLESITDTEIKRVVMERVLGTAGLQLALSEVRLALQYKVYRNTQ